MGGGKVDDSYLGKHLQRAVRVDEGRVEQHSRLIADLVDRREVALVGRVSVVCPAVGSRARCAARTQGEVRALAQDVLLLELLRRARLSGPPRVQARRGPLARGGEELLVKHT